MAVTLLPTAEDHQIAKMAALAIGLSLAEAVIPSPLPGVKPGLANIVTLVVLHRYGFKAAVWVSLLRVVAGSLIFGTFLSPTFVMSFTGALASLATLSLARHLPRALFGPVSHSILASFSHLGGQLAVVSLWLIPHGGIAYLIPIFAAAALLFGTMNGLIAARMIDAGDTLFGTATPARGTP